MSNANSPMRTFDPLLIAHYEKESWVAYYQKRWLRLMRVFVGLVQSTYGLTFLQAVSVGYLLTRAQIAFAPMDNNVTLAVHYMQRFFAAIKRIHHETFDEVRAARVEVNWWVVHRKLFGKTENQELVDAIAEAYAVEYQVEPARVLEAARYRAQAMVYSDQWVNSARQENSPLLAQEEEELLKSYKALRTAVNPNG